MPVNLVSDADVRAISIVGKGANRKRFFLTKAEGEEAERLPGAERLLKTADWSAVYAVVAEPGWHESPGSAPGTDQSIEDRWADEDEIRKAAHRFMANGGLVNKMHESLEPFGRLVENAVALDDFTIDGEVIRKGSWYVAIEPTAEGKAAIDKGEFTGVSIEGLAVRELVEKHSFSTDNPKTMEARLMSTSPLAEKVAKQTADGVADLISKAFGKPTAKEQEEATEDRLAEKVAATLAEQSRPSAGERACEWEGLDPSLAGVFGPSIGSQPATEYRPDQPLVAQAAAEPPAAELRKAYEERGLPPALAGLFGGSPGQSAVVVSKADQTLDQRLAGVEEYLAQAFAKKR